MTRLFYFEIVGGMKVIFRSDYFNDAIEASRRASEIVILMSRCAPSNELYYQVLFAEVVAGSVPDNFAL